MIELASTPDAFVISGGIPHPDWRTIERALGPQPTDPAALNALWCDLAHQWLSHLAGNLGPEYVLRESKLVLLVTGRECPNPSALLGVSERVAARLRAGLCDEHMPPLIGKHAIVVLDDLDLYYSYLAHYYPDGEHGGSAGICLRNGYLHVVTHAGNGYGLQSIVAHELSHTVLGVLDSPRWIDEAVARFAQELVEPEGRLTITREELRRHLLHWRRRGLDDFWSGAAFDEVEGRGEELSYHLATVLFRNLLSRFGRGGWAFVRAARSADGGAGAARDALGVTLGSLAAEVLGPGDWEPHEEPRA